MCIYLWRLRTPLPLTLAVQYEFQCYDWTIAVVAAGRAIFILLLPVRQTKLPESPHKTPDQTH